MGWYNNGHKFFFLTKLNERLLLSISKWSFSAYTSSKFYVESISENSEFPCQIKKSTQKHSTFLKKVFIYEQQACKSDVIVCLDHHHFNQITLLLHLHLYPVILPSDLLKQLTTDVLFLRNSKKKINHKFLFIKVFPCTIKNMCQFFKTKYVSIFQFFEFDKKMCKY